MRAVAISIQALLVLTFGLVMAFPWATPRYDVDTHTFDPHILQGQTSGIGLGESGSVSVDPQAITVATRPFSQPAIHILTTEAPEFSVGLVAHVEQSLGHVYPLQIRVWSPRHDLAAELWLDPSGGSALYGAERRGSEWLRPVPLLHVATPTTLQIEVKRSQCSILFVVADPGGAGAEWQTTCTEFPELFQQDTLSLTLYSTGLENASALTRYTDPRIKLPHQNLYGSGADDNRLPWAAAICGLLAVSVLATSFSTARFRRALLSSFLKIPAARNLVAIGLVLVAAVCLLGAGVLLGEHPYDAYSQGVWAYEADHYGPQQFYPLSMITPEGMAHGGAPYHAATLPYPPLFMALLGLLGHLFGALEPDYGPYSVGLQALIKAFHLSSLLAAGWIVGRWGLEHRRLVVPITLLDIALVVDAVLWNQMEAELVLFLVVAVVALQRGHLSTMLACIGFAFLAKQSTLMWVPWIVLVAWRLSGLTALLRASPLGLAPVAVFLVPLFMQGLHPGSLWLPTVHKGLQWNTVEHREESSAIVTTEAFNVWPLITGLAGVHGQQRLVLPDSDRIGTLPPTYFGLSRLLVVVGGIGGLGLVLLTRRSMWLSPQSLFLGLGLLCLVGPMLLTRMNTRYLLPGAALLSVSWALGGGWRTATAWLGISVVAALSMVTLLGQLASENSAVLPHLDPSVNPVTSILVGLGREDWFITAASLVTVASVGLGLSALFREREPAQTLPLRPRALREPLRLTFTLAGASVLLLAVTITSMSVMQPGPPPIADATGAVTQTHASPGEFAFASGFYAPEEAGDPFPRWTRGKATVVMQVDAQNSPIVAQIDLVQPDFGERRTLPDLAISFDGTPLLPSTWVAEQNPPGYFSVQVQLTPAADARTPHTLQLESPTFIPQQLESGSTDPRRLGVQLRRLSLKTDRGDLVSGDMPWALRLPPSSS